MRAFRPFPRSTIHFNSLAGGAGGVLGQHAFDRLVGAGDDVGADDFATGIGGGGGASFTTVTFAGAGARSIFGGGATMGGGGGKSFSGGGGGGSSSLTSSSMSTVVTRLMAFFTPS